MIIRKNDNGTYLTDFGTTIQSKAVYEQMLQEQLAIPEPSEEELIELGKLHHSFYMKDLAITNLQNQIDEIEEFDK